MSCTLLPYCPDCSKREFGGVATEPVGVEVSSRPHERVVSRRSKVSATAPRSSAACCPKVSASSGVSLKQPDGRERIFGHNHASRILGFLTRTLTEYEHASMAFLGDIRQQEELEEHVAQGSRPRAVTLEQLTAGMAPEDETTGAATSLHELLEMFRAYFAEIIDYMKAHRHGG